jgi:hypothetical protein
MSSAEVAVEETAVMTTTVKNWAATRSTAVLAFLATAQLIWLAALVYGVFVLLT